MYTDNILIRVDFHFFVLFFGAAAIFAGVARTPDGSCGRAA
jgi:hypothetical protein